MRHDKRHRRASQWSIPNPVTREEQTPITVEQALQALQAVVAGVPIGTDLVLLLLPNHYRE